jgi:hypothetical protein
MADLGYAIGGIGEADTSEESLLLSRLKRVEANPTGVYAVRGFPCQQTAHHVSAIQPNQNLL